MPVLLVNSRCFASCGRTYPVGRESLWDQSGQTPQILHGSREREFIARTTRRHSSGRLLRHLCFLGRVLERGGGAVEPGDCLADLGLADDHRWQQPHHVRSVGMKLSKGSSIRPDAILALKWILQ